MRPFPLPLLALCAPALLLTACSAEKSEAPASEEAAAAGAPNISGAVAPGVAFRYDYAFTLPGKAISQVQQKHAAACQKLGPDRCRVTGVSYEQPREDEVSARLDLLLAPDVAHAFGNDAIAAVEAAEGKIEHASVQGENAGDAIKLSQSDSAGIQAEIARIEARLGAKGLTGAERVELQQQVAGLREHLRGQVAERKAREASIASTPVSFNYTSEGILAGDGTFTKAASASWSSVESLLAFVTLLLGVALPWVALIGGGVLAWRWLRRSRIRTPEPAPSE
jgi:VIT1/CCC1 family predicted Fe2+/Mn2+ transporter